MKKENKKDDFIENEEAINRDKFAEEQSVDSEIEETDLPEEEPTVDDSSDLEKKYSELKDQNLRLMAEFDNYRKRTLKERSELIKTAGESVLANMLPLVDDFERAMKAMESTDDIAAVKEGIELIYEKFISFLSQNGIKEIPAENEPFDVDLHEAVTTFPAPSEDMKGKIMDCVSKGYTLNDKVIRYPKVVVCE